MESDESLLESTEASNVGLLCVFHKLSFSQLRRLVGQDSQSDDGDEADEDDERVDFSRVPGEPNFVALLRGAPSAFQVHCTLCPV